MVKILMGGSPCTYWSIAQTLNRETVAEGLGWELFKNYIIAKQKFKPDFFLYENNKSAAQLIKEQISIELGVDLMYINSALVSAQNRQRFYAFNWHVDQPEDRKIYLRDVLESGIAIREKAYTLDANYYKTLGRNVGFDKQSGRRKMVTEPIVINTTKDGKAFALLASDAKIGQRDLVACAERFRRTGVAEPVGIGDRNRIEDYGKLYRRYEEANYELIDGAEVIITDRAIRQGNREGTKQGKYVYLPSAEKTNTISAGQAHNEKVLMPVTEGKWKNIYQVENGKIEIKGKRYPINLPDGYYIIRKLTPIECERLQTLPDNYTAAVSATQRYKGLGNGWTAEVIIHILTGALKDVPKDEEIVVLSMYDGIGTGRYCLDKMGFTNVTYYAYEIDKYAIAVAMSNYPDIIQMGDAFSLRNDDWTL